MPERHVGAGDHLGAEVDQPVAAARRPAPRRRRRPRVSASSRASSASRPTRSRTVNPASRSRGSATAAARAPRPLPAVGLVEQGDLRPGWPRPETSRRSPGRRARHRGAARRRSPPGGRRPPSPAGATASTTRSAPNAVPGTASAGRSAYVTSRTWPLRHSWWAQRRVPSRRDRRGEGVVDRQQVAGLLLAAVADQRAEHVEAGAVGPAGVPGHGTGAEPVRQVEGVDARGRSLKGLTARRRRAPGEHVAFLAAPVQDPAMTSETTNSSVIGSASMSIENGSVDGVATAAKTKTPRMIQARCSPSDLPGHHAGEVQQDHEQRDLEGDAEDQQHPGEEREVLAELDEVRRARRG